MKNMEETERRRRKKSLGSQFNDEVLRQKDRIWTGLWKAKHRRSNSIFIIEETLRLINRVNGFI